VENSPLWRKHTICQTLFKCLAFVQNGVGCAVTLFLTNECTTLPPLPTHSLSLSLSLSFSLYLYIHI